MDSKDPAAESGETLTDTGSTGPETTDNSTDDPTDPSDTTDDTTDETTDDPTDPPGECPMDPGGGLGTGLLFEGQLPPRDVAPSCCDVFSQDCPVGEKCVPYGYEDGTWTGSKCVPIQGEGVAGDPCTYDGIAGATDDCGADFFCFNAKPVGLELLGVCYPRCGGTAISPTCEPGSECVVANNGSLALCMAACDPLLQDCGPDLACTWTSGAFVCLPTTQDIPLGESCSFINDCVPGTLCSTGSVIPNCPGDNCCASFCDLGDPTCPQAGTECVSFFIEGQAPPGYESVGVCVLP